ncbi:MAG: hypothetical protein U0324_23965 [Polyangiales bacterium]
MDSPSPLPDAFLAASRARARRRQLVMRILLALLASAVIAGLVSLSCATTKTARRAADARHEADALTRRRTEGEAPLLLELAREAETRGAASEALVLAIAARNVARSTGTHLAPTEQALAARRSVRPWQRAAGIASNRATSTGHADLAFREAGIGAVALIDSVSGDERAVFAYASERCSGELEGGSVSPDGRLVLLQTVDCDNARRLSLWEVAPTRMRWSRPPLPSHLDTSFAWGLDGRSVLLVGRDSGGDPMVWLALDLANGRPVRQANARYVGADPGEAGPIETPPSARRFLVSDTGGGPPRWAYANGTLAAALTDADTLSGMLSPDGRFAVTTSAGGSARRWDASSGALLGEVPSAPVRAWFLGEGERFVTTPDLAVWESATGGRLHALVGAGRAAGALVRSADGRCAASWGPDDTLSTWSVADGTSTGVFRFVASARNGPLRAAFEGGSCDLMVSAGGSLEHRLVTPATLDPDAPRDVDAFAAWALQRTPLRVRRDTHAVVDDSPAPPDSPWARAPR